MYVFTYVSIYLLCLKSMFIQNTYSIHLHWIRNNTVFCAHGWFYVFFSKSRYATTALLLRLILYCCHQCPTATYSFNLEASTPSQIPCAQAKTVFLQEASPCPWRRVVRQRTQCLRTCSTHHIMFFGEMLKRSENVFLFFRDMLTSSDIVFLFFRHTLGQRPEMFFSTVSSLHQSSSTPASRIIETDSLLRC